MPCHFIQKRASQKRPHKTNETGRRVGMLYLKARSALRGKWKVEERAWDVARKNPFANPNNGFLYGEQLAGIVWGERYRRAHGLAPKFMNIARPSTLKPSKRLR